PDARPLPRTHHRVNSMRHLLVAPARSSSIKWGAVMLVVAACVGYLIYSASGGSSEYYLTVSELRAHPAYDQDVRVAGVVQNDVKYAPRGTVEFTEQALTAPLRLGSSG